MQDVGRPEVGSALGRLLALRANMLQSVGDRTDKITRVVSNRASRKARRNARRTRIPMDREPGGATRACPLYGYGGMARPADVRSKEATMSRRRVRITVVLATCLGIAFTASGCGFGPMVLEQSHGRYTEAIRHVDEETAPPQPRPYAVQ